MSKTALSSSDESTDETERTKIIESSSDDDEDDATDDEPIIPKPKSFMSTTKNKENDDDDSDEDEEKTESENKNPKKTEKEDTDSDETISTNASVSLLKPKRQNSLESEENDSTDSLSDKRMNEKQPLISDDEEEDSETQNVFDEPENCSPNPATDESLTEDEYSDEDCLSQNSLAEMIESQIKNWYKEDGLKRPKRQSKEILDKILQQGVDISDINLNEEEQEKLNTEIDKIKNLTLDDLIFHINHSE